MSSLAMVFARYLLAFGCAGLAALTVHRLVTPLRRNVGLHAVGSRVRTLVLEALNHISQQPAWDANKACIILSGGLDTSICAEAGHQILGLSRAFTVLATPDATDRPYARRVASASGLSHCQIETSLGALLEELPWVVRVLQTFDPMSLRNSIAVARALKEAQQEGFTCAVTGDGADEVFGGYSFTTGLEASKWAQQRARMVAVMHYDSIRLGQHLGIHVASPYLDPDVIEYALSLSKADCVAEHEGRLLGKMALRVAFPEVTSCWRTKDPIEVGCGSTELGKPGFFDNRISNADFDRDAATIARQHEVTIRDKEHLHYYRVFRQVFPNGLVPGKARRSWPTPCCPKCLYELSSPEQTFCVTCGHYDPNMPQHSHAAPLRSVSEQCLDACSGPAV